MYRVIYALRDAQKICAYTIVVTVLNGGQHVLNQAVFQQYIKNSEIDGYNTIIDS